MLSCKAEEEVRRHAYGLRARGARKQLVGPGVIGGRLGCRGCQPVGAIAAACVSIMLVHVRLPSSVRQRHGLSKRGKKVY